MPHACGLTGCAFPGTGGRHPGPPATRRLPRQHRPPIRLASSPCLHLPLASTLVVLVHRAPRPIRRPRDHCQGSWGPSTLQGEAKRAFWPVKPTPPFVPGHEGVGVVHALGEGVTSVSLGETVAVPWLGFACRECKHCLTGWETLCLRQQDTGYSVDGCYAEYFLAEAAFAAKVPAGISPARRGTADVRGSHHLQGDQGRQCAGGPTWWPSPA